jgi:hypothetical protein
MKETSPLDARLADSAGDFAFSAIDFAVPAVARRFYIVQMQGLWLGPGRARCPHRAVLCLTWGLSNGVHRLAHRSFAAADLGLAWRSTEEGLTTS